MADNITTLRWIWLNFQQIHDYFISTHFYINFIGDSGIWTSLRLSKILLRDLDSDCYASKAKKATTKASNFNSGAECVEICAFIALIGRFHRSSFYWCACRMRSIRPSQHTYSKKNLGLRDRTECIQKSQTWLPFRLMNITM